MLTRQAMLYLFNTRNYSGNAKTQAYQATLGLNRESYITIKHLSLATMMTEIIQECLPGAEHENACVTGPDTEKL